MLKKIENIASAAEFKNNTRFSPSINSIPVINSGKSVSSDSLSFSSAFRYLSQLRWQLKSLEHNEHEEFNLEFIVDDLSFKTKISLHDCSSSNISYKVSNELANSSSGHIYNVIIAFDFDSDVFYEAALESKTDYLNWLFQKFASYDSILLKSSSNPDVNAFFIDEVEKKLRYELSLIHRNLIVFVEKVSGEILTSNLKHKTSDSNQEKLIKILQINVKL